MEVVRHGRPHSSYLATLREPQLRDYFNLVRVCVEAIVNGQEDVIIAFSYVLKFPAGFPKGMLIRKTGATNVHQIKARKLLTWLNENGYTGITVKDLRYQRVAFTRHIESVGNMDLAWIDELNVDKDQDLVHNDASQG